MFPFWKLETYQCSWTASLTQSILSPEIISLNLKNVGIDRNPCTESSIEWCLTCLSQQQNQNISLCVGLMETAFRVFGGIIDIENETYDFFFYVK